MSDPTDISDELSALLEGAVKPKVLRRATSRRGTNEQSQLLIERLTHVGYGLVLVGVFAEAVSAFAVRIDPFERMSLFVFGFVTSWFGACRLDRANRERRRVAKELDGLSAPLGSIARFPLRRRA